MDTYEKAYKDALERAKKLQETCDSQAVIGWCEYIFPELSESDDERIRKELINTINLSYDSGIAITKENRDKYIAWLEKQGEQKAILDELEMTLSVSEDAYLRSNLEKLIKEFKNGTRRKTELIEMFEVDGFLTEEDEKCIDNCCLLIGAADDCYEKTFKDDCIHYLQSLKERIAPKPKWTDEDEKRLQSCIISLQGKGLMGGVDTINTKWLKSLKQRMKG